MGGFRAWLALLGLASIGAAIYGIALAARSPAGAALIGAGVTSAIWCFGIASVVAAIQRIEAKLGTAPEPPKKPASAPASPPDGG